jgi:hypothetical protein
MKPSGWKMTQLRGGCEGTRTMPRKKLTIVHHVNELPVPGQKYLDEKG